MPSLSLFIAFLLATRPELEAARRTRTLLEEKLVAREQNLRARVVALYKLSAFGELPAWVDDQARRELLRRRGAARRMIVRDLEERKLLRDELDSARADEARLAAEPTVPPPPAGSLARPVPGRVVAPYGVALDPRTGLRLPRFGVGLHSVPGSVVSAVAPGRVVHAGTVRGLGQAVVIDHGGGLVSVVGGLVRALVTRGDTVAAGSMLGAAAGDLVRLEIRAGGRALDPAPLLRP